MNNPASNQWISVKERLPQHMRPMFCYDCNGNPVIAWISNGRWTKEGGFGSIETEITHWMECEPPPKPDPFEEWWNNLITYDINHEAPCFLKKAVEKGHAKLIWDAATESFNREAKDNIQSQLHETLCQPRNPPNT